ncbi:MAG: LamG domain-containing protein [Crocosphaera sp.]
MSNKDDSLQLYLKLDEVQDGQVIDTSGNERNGTIIGNPKIVDGDFVGKCLQLDRKEDEIDLSNLAIPIRGEMTVGFWVHFNNDFSVEGIFITMDDGKFIDDDIPVEKCRIVLPSIMNNEVYFQCGHQNGQIDVASKDISGLEVNNKWSYWAFTKDVNKGEMKIYLNGTLWYSDTEKLFQIPEIKIVKLGSTRTVEKESYIAKVAHFRIYSRALSPEEIREDMALSIAPELEEELNELPNSKETQAGLADVLNQLQSLKETQAELKEAFDKLRTELKEGKLDRDSSDEKKSEENKNTQFSKQGNWQVISNLFDLPAVEQKNSEANKTELSTTE